MYAKDRYESKYYYLVKSVKKLTKNIGNILRISLNAGVISKMSTAVLKSTTWERNKRYHIRLKP